MGLRLGLVWGLCMSLPEKKKKKNILTKKIMEEIHPGFFQIFWIQEGRFQMVQMSFLWKNVTWNEHFAPENRRVGPKRKVQDRLKTITFQGIWLLVKSPQEMWFKVHQWVWKDVLGYHNPPQPEEENGETANSNGITCGSFWEECPPALFDFISRHFGFWAEVVLVQLFSHTNAFATLCTSNYEIHSKKNSFSTLQPSNQ